MFTDSRVQYLRFALFLPSWELLRCLSACHLCILFTLSYVNMEGISSSSHSHSNPAFKRLKISPEQYLTRERFRLLRELLPRSHALHSRIKRQTGSILEKQSFPCASRDAFTADELEAIKLRRKTTAPDQNEAKVYLQDTNLLNMWNTDCQTKEQWAEYDSVQPLMEISMIRSQKPHEAFQPDFAIGEKRKRVVSDEVRTVKLKADDLDDEKSELLEDGEIVEEQDAVQSIEEENGRLKLEHEALKAYLKSQGFENGPFNKGEPSPPASPPESEKTEDSDDDERDIDCDLDVEADDDVGNIGDFDEPEEEPSEEPLEVDELETSSG